MKGQIFELRKKRPVAYAGRRCVVACCDCDKDWLKALIDQFQLLYEQDPENLTMELWRKGKKKEECAFLFISFPIGDHPLVTFLLSGLNLVVEPWHGDPVNANRLAKPAAGEITIHTMYETMIDAYQARDYDRIGEIIMARGFADDGDQAGFYLFMCLLGLTRLVRQRGPLAKGRDRRALGMTAYLRFHERHNGTDSKQYAQALVLRVFCFGTTCPTAEKDLLDASLILKWEDSMLNMLSGHLCFESRLFSQAFKCYKSTRVEQSEEIATRLCDAGYWHKAYPFTVSAKSVRPCEENLMRFLQCLCALGDKALAIQTVGVKNRKMLDGFKKSEYQFCRGCREIRQRAEMISCEECGDAYYCSQDCLLDDGAEHAAFSCRNCQACGVYIPKSHSRLRCSGCWVTFYCSEECQQRDWFENDHKNMCGK